MAQALTCCCETHFETEINSAKAFQEIQQFFEQENLQESPPSAPYFSWTDGKRKVEWFATQWFRCSVCGCLWEFQHPDFPAKGFVRKFPSGVYRQERR